VRVLEGATGPVLTQPDEGCRAAMSFETGRLETGRLSAELGSASLERSYAVEIDGERGAPSPKNSLRPVGANTVFLEDIAEGLGQIYG
jgi:hypothetical protein